MRAGGERDAQLARYQAELSRFLQDSAPRGDGGFDYELFNEMFPEQHKIPVEPGGPYYQEGAPDTDPYYY